MPKVENMCKTLLKTMCKFCVQCCGILKISKTSVENNIITHTNTANSTNFSTSNSSLFPRSLFHFSTEPIITIINI